MKRTKEIIFLLAVLFARQLNAQNIYSTSATSNGMAAVFDANCNMYFIEYNYCRIKKKDASSGTVTTIANSSGYCSASTGDGGAAVAATMYDARYLAIDKYGNVYIAVTGDNVIRKINTSGVISTVAGTGTAGFNSDGIAANTAKLNGPQAVAVDNSGNIYIADGANYRIRVVNSSGIINTLAGTGTAGWDRDGFAANTAKVHNITGMKLNADQTRLYLVDNAENVVRVIDLTTGIIGLVAGSGSTTYGGDGGHDIYAGIPYPVDIAVDNAENLYITEYGSGVVRMVDNLGTITRYAGNVGSVGYAGDGNPAINSSVNLSAYNVCVDNTGNVFISDFGGTSGYPIRYVCAASVPSFTITSSPVPGSTICPTTPVTFTANSANGGCGNELTWYKSSSSIPVGTGITYTDYYPSVPFENVYCIATPATNAIHSSCTPGTGATSNTITINVDNLQVTDIDINTLCVPGSYGSTAPNPQITVTASGGSGSLSYSWSYGYHNNVYLYGGSSPTPTITGLINTGLPPIVNVTVYVTDANGCSTTKTAYTKLITSGYDLATRDGHFDLYDESCVSMIAAGVTDIWHSPDIWNRHHSDGAATFPYNVNEVPQFVPSTSSPLGLDNHIYTLIRNVGCIASPDVSAGVYDPPAIYWYWTSGGTSLAEVWPGDWTVNNSPGWPTGTSQPTGRSIGGSYIASIPAGGTLLKTASWHVPNPQKYLNGHTSNDMDLCVLTRIVDYHNPATSTGNPITGPGMTIAEDVGYSPSTNVRNNNNISTLNTNVMNANHFSPRPYHLLFGNYVHTTEASSPQSLQFINDFSSHPGTGTSTLSGFVKIKAFLGDLYDIWQSNGGYSPNSFTSDANERSVTFDGSNTVQLDSIRLDSGAVYDIRLEISMLDGVDGTAMQPETIHVYGLQNKRIVIDSILDTTIAIPTGGFTFNVQYSGDPNPSGVLAVTELSQGPTHGCQYAEMIVANCGSDASLYVNMQGWVVDDNTGILDTSGSCDTSHYRLAYDDTWTNVQVGSRIVMYNHDVNCYNLPDTFTYDDSNHIYWIPIGGTPDAPFSTPHVERFKGTDNSNTCAYCSDLGDAAYSTASDWMHSVKLDNFSDGVQVRCPGCTGDRPGSPQFYNGVKYQYNPDPDPDVSFGLTDIGITLFAPSGANYKYVFTGSTSLDLLDPTKWLVTAADVAGSAPSTLGYVNDDFYYATFTHNLLLPCCGDGSGLRGMLPPSAAANNATNIKVYPNPTNTTLTFEFSSISEVTIKIMDITGRVMEQQVIHDGKQITFDVKGYTPGIYIYHVVTGGKTQSGKVVIQ